eukprot:m51a1_g1248 hypothetical protein (378) ;mRNA; r:13471-14689
MEQRTTEHAPHAVYATRDYRAGEPVLVESPLLATRNGSLPPSSSVGPALRAQLDALVACAAAPLTPDRTASLLERGVPAGDETALLVAHALESCGVDFAGETALFARGCALPHSCAPSVAVGAADEAARTLEWRALRDIRAGEALSVSWLGDRAMRGRAQRRAALLRERGVDCRCPRCASGYDAVSAVLCPRCRGAEAMLSNERGAWECPACGALDGERDWAAGFWEGVERLCAWVEAADDEVSETGRAPDMTELAQRYVALVQRVGKWHWAPMTLLLMMYDTQLSALRAGRGPQAPGSAVQRLLDIDEQFAKWLARDPRMDLPAELSPMTRERRQALRELLCPVCRRAEASSACSRCHSKEDWPQHKLVCVAAEKH